MWGELERSPMLAAPGSADVTRLSTYTNVIGPDDDDVQAANDLCKKYLPLAQSIARKYQGRGIDDSDLDFAAEYGLAAAVLKFDPDRGAFGSYAKFWIKGEITRLFKLKGDALNNAQSLTKTNCGEEEFHQRDVTDERTFAPSIDLSELSTREKRVVVGRISGATLNELGSELGVSKERVRQIDEAATKKLRKKPGQIALACIRDLTKRRGYHKPSRQLLPYKKRRSPPALLLSKEEVRSTEVSRPEILSVRPEKQIDWYREHADRLRYAEETAGVRR